MIQCPSARLLSRNRHVNRSGSRGTISDPQQGRAGRDGLVSAILHIMNWKQTEHYQHPRYLLISQRSAFCSTVSCICICDRPTDVCEAREDVVRVRKWVDGSHSRRVLKAQSVQGPAPSQRAVDSLSSVRRIFRSCNCKSSIPLLLPAYQLC